MWDDDELYYRDCSPTYRREEAARVAEWPSIPVGVLLDVATRTAECLPGVVVGILVAAPLSVLGSSATCVTLSRL